MRLIDSRALESDRMLTRLTEGVLWNLLDSYAGLGTRFDNPGRSVCNFVYRVRGL